MNFEVHASKHNHGTCSNKKQKQLKTRHTKKTPSLSSFDTTEVAKNSHQSSTKWQHSYVFISRLCIAWQN
jgi:hypothetical protein